MLEVWAMVVYGLGPPLIGLVALVTRLSWQARRDRKRQDTPRALVAQRLDAEVVYVHDVRDDGSHLRLRITGGGMVSEGTNE